MHPDAQPDVSTWLGRALERHQMRYRPFDWPDLGGDEGILFLEVWLRAFEADGVTEAEVDAASVSLGATPPKYRSEHLPAILKAIREARRERTARCRVYTPDYPTVPASERFVWPAEVERGDIIGLCEYLTSRGRRRAAE